MIESLRLALQGIMSNRLRSALTMLGILIGVAAVIILIAVGAGSSAAVQNQLAGLGHQHTDDLPDGRLRAAGRGEPHGHAEPPGDAHREGCHRSPGQDERTEHHRGGAGRQRERDRDVSGRHAPDRARRGHDTELPRGPESRDREWLVVHRRRRH